MLQQNIQASCPQHQRSERSVTVATNRAYMQLLAKFAKLKEIVDNVSYTTDEVNDKRLKINDNLYVVYREAHANIIKSERDYGEDSTIISYEDCRNLQNSIKNQLAIDMDRMATVVADSDLFNGDSNSMPTINGLTPAMINELKTAYKTYKLSIGRATNLAFSRIGYIIQECIDENKNLVFGRFQQYCSTICVTEGRTRMHQVFDYMLDVVRETQSKLYYVDADDHDGVLSERARQAQINRLDSHEKDILFASEYIDQAKMQPGDLLRDLFNITPQMQPTEP